MKTVSNSSETVLKTLNNLLLFSNSMYFGTILAKKLQQLLSTDIILTITTSSVNLSDVHLVDKSEALNTAKPLFCATEQ